MAGENGCNHTELEKGLLEVTKQVGGLLSVTSSLETAVENISEAIQAIATKEVTVEQHSKLLESLQSKVNQNEKDIRDIMLDIHTRVELKDLHLTKEGLEEKVETYVKDLYKFNWKMMWASMSALVLVSGVIFSYILLSKEEHSEVNKSIVKTLNRLDKTITKVDKTVSNIVIRQDYMEEKIDEK